MQDYHPPKAEFWEVESVILPTGDELRPGEYAYIVEPSPGYFSNSDVKDLLGVRLHVIRVENGRRQSIQRRGSFFTLSEVVFLNPQTQNELRMHVSHVRKAQQ
jgi:hypothetical protein